MYLKLQFIIYYFICLIFLYFFLYLLFICYYYICFIIYYFIYLHINIISFIIIMGYYTVSFSIVMELQPLTKVDLYPNLDL